MSSPSPQRPGDTGTLSQPLVAVPTGVPVWTDDESSDDGFVPPPPPTGRTESGAAHVVTSPRGGGSSGGAMAASSEEAGASVAASASARGLSQSATIIDLGASQRNGSMAGGGNGGGADSGGSILFEAADAAGAALGVARDRAQSAMQWITRGSVFQTYLTLEAKIMTALIVVSCLVFVSMAAAIIIVSYTKLREFSVTDGSVCKGTTYEEIKTNSVGYNMANIVVGCAFALWLMVRAVRLEKGALLVCVVVVIITVVARAFYFAFIVAGKSLDPSMHLASQIVLPVAAVVMLAAIPFSFKVSEGFGWRFFTKGVTQAEDVEAMQQYKRLDACAKLDLYITLNAFIALFFFVSDNFLRIYGFVVAAITVIFLVLLTSIVKKRRYWALYLFYLCCILMPVFYIYTLTTVVLRGDQACPQDLTNCLDNCGVDVYRCSTTASGKCLVPTVCLAQPNVTLQARCNTTALDTAGECCSEYGRCQLKVQFLDSDKPLILFLAVVGCLVRALTVYVGYKQAQAMDVPNVQEMLRRGEHNLKNFSLPTFLSTGSFRKARSAPGSPADASTTTKRRAGSSFEGGADADGTAMDTRRASDGHLGRPERDGSLQ